MSEKINIFETIKELIINSFGKIDSDYCKRINLNTNKDLEYFEGEAKAVASTCEKCVALNNCIFYHDNLSNYRHQKCKCLYVPCDNIFFMVKIPIDKIDKYLMVCDKKVIFEKLGYTISDSEYIRKSISESALENYKNGKYILKELDKYGQRLGIETVVFSKDNKRFIEFYSGWKLFPNGKIINTTPFGGWKKERKL